MSIIIVNVVEVYPECAIGAQILVIAKESRQGTVRNGSIASVCFKGRHGTVTGPSGTGGYLAV